MPLGYHHTNEAKIKQSISHTGELNVRWNPNNPHGGRMKARRLYHCPLLEYLKLQRHHIDGNPRNNDPSNIAFLNASDHKKIHAKKGPHKLILVQEVIRLYTQGKSAKNISIETKTPLRTVFFWIAHKENYQCIEEMKKVG